ncbi:MAG: DUF167 domain-containing protein [Phycisphaeraceae bacterium]
MADERWQCERALEPGEAGGTLIRLKVVPGASRTRLMGMLGDRLKVQLAAPPEGGKANQALCRFLAKLLGCSRSDIVIAAGATQPLKTVAAPLAPAEVAGRLRGA